MLHIWHEDSNNSSTTQFWDFLSMHNVHNLLNGVDIQGFGSNSNLFNFLKTYKINSKDKYIILIDAVWDNRKAYTYFRDTKNMMAKYSNVVVSDLLCFEYLMLRYKHLVTWTEPMKPIRGYIEAKEIREKFIHLIDEGKSWVTDNDIVNYVVKHTGIDTTKPNWRNELQFISSENIATWLLSQMTNGGTIRFGVSKTLFGSCWYSNCCNLYINKQIGEKKCRIYNYVKTSQEKAKNLWNGTVAKQIINSINE